MAACGGDDSNGDPLPAADESQALNAFTLVAESLAWDLDSIVVPAGEEVVATVDNRDAAIVHNLRIKAPGDPQTKLEKGPIVQTLVSRSTSGAPTTSSVTPI